MAGSRIGVCVHGVALNTWCDRCPSGKRYQITVSGTTASSTQETPEPPQAADEPRAIVRAFALAMERKLAANDGVKGGWRDTGAFKLWWMALHEVEEFRDALYAYVNAEDHDAPEDVLADARLALLHEGADVANVLMMICDVCGALPPTDERGR